MKESILIKNGTVIDGTGAPSRQEDILIRWGRIVAVDAIGECEAEQVIDASGYVVCPGFIDTHTHSDLALLADPDHEGALAQGITTEILGQDGLSYAPLSEDNLREYRRYLGGLNGNPSLSERWSSVREFRRLFDGTVAINTVYQVPHGALRLETVGWQDVPLEGAALSRVQDLLAKSFEEGAAAFSTGLSYYPCSYADTTELIELCKVASAYGKPYVVHLRTVFPDTPFDPVEEAIRIAEQSKVALHISHFRTTPETAGSLPKVLAPLEAALDRGVDITLETYPYPAGAGFTMVMLPRWAHVGGYKGLMARLADKNVRGKMVEAMYSEGLVHDGILTYLPPGSDKELLGKTLSELAAAAGVDLASFVCDLMFRNNLQVGYMSVPPDKDTWEQIEADIRELIQKPYYMVGSDSIRPALFPHPRTNGCFPRFLRWQRELDFMPLETLINRMTGLPAKRFGLKDRGTLSVGKAGDLVVFDPKAIADQATYQQPNKLATGVISVLVNGEVVFKQGKALGVYPGLALPIC